jgi:hypothetical protein
MQVWQLEPSVMPDEPAAAASLHSRPWRLVLRALLLTLSAGVFLILMASMASALDVPDATEVVGGTSDEVADTADTVTDTADTVAGTADATDEADTSDTTGAVGNTADAVGTTTGAVGNTGDAVDNTAGAVGNTAGAVGNTAGAVADTTTDVVGNTTDAVGDTTDATTPIVHDAAAAAVGAAEVVGDLTPGVLGTAGGVVQDGVGLVDDVADGALDGVSTTLDPVTKTIGGVVDGLSDGVSDGAIPIPDLTAPDPIAVPSESPPGTDPSEPRTGSRGHHRSPIERGPVSGTAAIATTDVHLASTGALRPDAGGAVPGRPSNGGLPSPLDVAAAALRGLPEAGGSSLVLWALVALVGLLPVLDDRWLRFVRPVSPRAPHVAQDGRPG